jgi:outer membrane protein
MRVKVQLTVVLMVLGTVSILCAQESLSSPPDTSVDLSMEKAVRSALSQNNTIRHQRITLAAAKRRAVFSWNSISPSLALSGGGTVPAGKDASDGTVYVEGKISISLMPDIAFSVQKAWRDYEAEKISYDTTIHTIEGNVRSAYLTLLYEQENIRLQNRNLDTARNQYEQNVQRYQLGSVSELDMLSSRVTWERLKPQVQEASVTYDADKALFLQLTGLEQHTDVRLQKSLASYAEQYSGFTSEKNMKQIEALLSGERAPSILSAAKKLQASKAALAKSRLNAYGPSVTAAWSYAPAAVYTDASKSWQDRGSLSLGVSVPLDSWLPWSAGREGVLSAKDTAADSELTLEEVRDSVQIHAANCIRRISQKEKSILFQNTNIKLAEQSYRMALDAYVKGSKDLLSLQNASNTLLEAEVTLESDLLDYVKTCIELEQLLGIPYGTLRG